MSDAPIEPQDYIYGVKVVQIEDLRVARGLTRRPTSSCRHKKLVYDDKERRIWCSDCEQEVEAFDAFVGIVEVFSGGMNRIKHRQEQLAQAEKFQIISRAAKVMDEAWRRRSMYPLCPHCNAAITPDDVVKGVALTGRKFVDAKRAKAKPQA